MFLVVTLYTDVKKNAQLMVTLGNLLYRQPLLDYDVTLDHRHVK